MEVTAKRFSLALPMDYEDLFWVWKSTRPLHVEDRIIDIVNAALEKMKEDDELMPESAVIKIEGIILYYAQTYIIDPFRTVKSVYQNNKILSCLSNAIIKADNEDIQILVQEEIKIGDIVNQILKQKTAHQITANDKILYKSNKYHVAKDRQLISVISQ